MWRSSRTALLVCFLLLYPCCLSFAEVLTTDTNADGKLDGWTYIENGRIERQEIDVNFDGRIDSVFIYGSSGQVREEILDTNYDGKMDNWRLYENGELTVDSLDSNMDGMIDLWIHVVKGKIMQIEKDTDGDGKPDTTTGY
jgi:hypothetical protein